MKPTSETRLPPFGAAGMSSKDLLAVLLKKSSIEQAELALSLVGSAREAALRAIPGTDGEKLMAALEIGRRAWMLPSPVGRRIRAPVDVAAATAPRVSQLKDAERWLLALDSRLTVAAIVDLDNETPGQIVREALVCGTSKFIVVSRRASRAVPTSQDEELAADLIKVCQVVDASLLDMVLLGDDGFCSLTRLGLIPSADPRYR